jgi:hypothetical protein
MTEILLKAALSIINQTESILEIESLRLFFLILK